MKTPRWWYQRGQAPWWRFALGPITLIWLGVNALKAATAKPYRSSLKVISIGNVTLGGSGKTPVADEVLRVLGGSVSGLSRGHKGVKKGPIRVDFGSDSGEEVGDEALILAQHHDFWISRDRAAGLRAIEASGAATVVVDDAHQNLTIVKDVHVLVVDGDTRDGAWPFGDGGVVPCGPMREPLGQGLARTDVVVIWMPDSSAVDAGLMQLFAGKPVFVARLKAQRPEVDGPVVAYAGIAKPWKFEATLRELGVEVAAFHSFADHVSPTEAELEAMVARGAVITTEKDWVRLSPEWRKRIWYLPIRARFDDEAGFVRALEMSGVR